MFWSANEGFTRSRLYRKVQYNVFESRIRGMTVAFPVRRPRIEFDRAVMSIFIDEDGAIEEIRARSMIPFAKLSNLNCLSIKALK